MKIFFTTVITLAAFVAPLAAQWAQYHTPGVPRTADGKPNLTAPAPRTADGKPDLSGLWNINQHRYRGRQCRAPQTGGPPARRHSALGAGVG